MDFEKIDYDLIEATLLHIVDCYPKEGSILVFLPGMQEIMTAFDQVKK
jgi:HrpA-like RNA helicase